jgi:hypothetical protein
MKKKNLAEAARVSLKTKATIAALRGEEWMLSGSDVAALELIVQHKAKSAGQKKGKTSAEAMKKKEVTAQRNAVYQMMADAIWKEDPDMSAANVATKIKEGLEAKYWGKTNKTDVEKRLVRGAETIREIIKRPKTPP